MIGMLGVVLFFCAPLGFTQEVGVNDDEIAHEIMDETTSDDDSTNHTEPAEESANTADSLPADKIPNTNMNKVIQNAPKPPRSPRRRARYQEKRTDGTRAVKRLDGRSILIKSFYQKDGRALDVDFN